MEYPIYFSAKTTFVGRQRLTCQRPNLNYLTSTIYNMKRSSSSGEQSRGPGQSKLSQFFSKRQKESGKISGVDIN
jgi:hypothetical protein